MSPANTNSTSVPDSRLPQCRGERLVADGGLETDLIFHHGIELPHFASFPLLDHARGREQLTAYFDE